MKCKKCKAFKKVSRIQDAYADCARYAWCFVSFEDQVYKLNPNAMFG